MLINRKKAHKPFIDAHEVARRIGGISAKSVSNRTGITKDLTRFPLGGKFGYDQDEVEALAQSIRDQVEEEKKERSRLLEPYERALRVVGSDRAQVAQMSEMLEKILELGNAEIEHKGGVLLVNGVAQW